MFVFIISVLFGLLLLYAFALVVVLQTPFVPSDVSLFYTFYLMVALFRNPHNEFDLELTSTFYFQSPKLHLMLVFNHILISIPKGDSLAKCQSHFAILC